MTIAEIIAELRSMASQILSPGSAGKAMFEQAANELEFGQMRLNELKSKIAPLVTELSTLREQNEALVEVAQVASAFLKSWPEREMSVDARVNLHIALTAAKAKGCKI